LTTKTHGAELKAFYNDDGYWLKTPDSKIDDVWHEELCLLVNDVEQVDDFSITGDLKDEDRVTIVDGLVTSSRDDFADRTFESFFKTWRKQQNTAYIAVTVPKDKLEAVRAAIKAAGGSIK
jgi:hypothetical protein